MPFSQLNALRAFHFDALPIRHGIFTRHGGVSPAPWSSLNVGGTVGDERDRVVQNRLSTFEAMDCDPNSIFDVWQVHGVDVACGDSPRDLNLPVQKADIILTDKPDVTLFMRFADCVPILSYDPRKKVIGISHAGWMGTVQDVAGATVRAMQSRYGSDPNDIIAGIGPSIGPDHYEIGKDVISRVNEMFESNSHLVLEEHGSAIHFDLWKANRLLLEKAGVHAIELSGICTACHLDDWYSHRKEKGRTGRFGVLMSLAPRL